MRPWYGHWHPGVKCLRKKKKRSDRPWYGHWGFLNSYGHWWVIYASVPGPVVSEAFTFLSISGTCWKVSEVIDFNLKYQNSDLPTCFLALICDFSQFIRIPLSKPTKTGLFEYLQIYYLWTRESEVSELYINLFVLKFSFCWYTIHELRISQVWNQEEEIIFEALVYMIQEQIVSMPHFFKHG